MFNGYVLHTNIYKETSIIAKCFIKEYGLINLVANGAKRKKSLFYSLLQPFIPLMLYWNHKNTDLHTLHKAEAYAMPYRLSGVYLFSGLYVNELLLKLLRVEDKYVELFNSYQNFLANLANFSKYDKINQIKTTKSNNIITDSINISTSKHLEQNLRFIEKQILKAIGYELQLDRESYNGDPINSNAIYYFDLEHGLNLVKKSESQISNLSKDKTTISGKSLLALHNNNFSDIIEMKEAKLFMRNIIANFLGNKQLFTRRLFS